MFFAANDANDHSLPNHVTQLRRVRSYKPAPDNIATFDDWCDRCGGVTGCSRQSGSINTGNSASGAIQLAIQLGYTDILIVGIDGGGGYHDGTGRPRDLHYLPDLMQALADDLPPGVTVRNASEYSLITCFDHTTLAEWLCQ